MKGFIFGRKSDDPKGDEGEHGQVLVYAPTRNDAIKRILETKTLAKDDKRVPIMRVLGAGDCDEKGAVIKAGFDAIVEAEGSTAPKAKAKRGKR